ncbi:hypothetical protein LQK93_01627 [Terrabacter sp. BE26]
MIPIFQRPYVWDESKNWLPLWEDIRKAAEAAEKESVQSEEAPSEYFLGAVVTQSRSPVPRRTQMSMVIDGQQRLTTFQVFLAAARRVAVELGAVHAADSFAALVRNRVSLDTDHPEDRYKVVPLAHDAPAFEWALRDPGHAGAAPDGRHRLVRASHWFEAALRDWLAEAASASERLDFLHFAVENRIKVVSIYLDPTDDPQVIFEALNHRGVRLDAADLVKNFLFQLLDRQGDHHLEGELLSSHWSVLDSDHWRSEVTTGRIKRVRVDSLLAYWLAAQRGEESSVEHLFEDIKRWMRASRARAADVIRDIRVYADTMDRLQHLPMTSPVAQALDRLDATGTTTPWPLVLFLHATSAIPQEQAEIGTLAIDSFLMRRAICRLTTSDYNRLFGSLLGSIKAVDPQHAGESLVEGLAAQTAPSRMWPDDGQFAAALRNSNLYVDIVRPRLRALLVGLENALHNSRSEPALPHRAAAKHLTIEHVMPVKWEAHWRLPADATEEEHLRRQEAVHRLGNLTLATQSLNSTLSNEPWDKKRRTLQTHSLARLTTASILTSPDGAHEFAQEEWTAEWDEQRILLREEALVREALRLWPRSGTTPPDLGTPRVTKPAEIVVAASAPPTVSAQRHRVTNDVQGDLLPLIHRGLVAPGDVLRHTKVRSGRTYTATITSSGGLDTVLGPFRAPSTALSKMLGSSVNGWITWTHDPSGKTLAELREMLKRE